MIPGQSSFDILRRGNLPSFNMSSVTIFDSNSVSPTPVTDHKFHPHPIFDPPAPPQNTPPVIVPPIDYEAKMKAKDQEIATLKKKINDQQNTIQKQKHLTARHKRGFSRIRDNMAYLYTGLNLIHHNADNLMKSTCSIMSNMQILLTDFPNMTPAQQRS